MHRNKALFLVVSIKNTISNIKYYSCADENNKLFRRQEAVQRTCVLDCNNCSKVQRFKFKFCIVDECIVWRLLLLKILRYNEFYRRKLPIFSKSKGCPVST